MIIKVRCKLNNRVSIFRFFSKEYSDQFWYTPTNFSYGFNLGHMKDYEPINKTWDEVRDVKER